MDYETLKKCELFQGMDEAQISDAVNNLDGMVLTAEKNKYIFNEGESYRNAAVIISGSALAFQEDYTGGFRNVVAELGPGSTIATSASLLSIPSAFSVVTREETVYFAFNAGKLRNTSASHPQSYILFVNNLLLQVSKTMVRLFEKINFLTQRTTRARLMSFLVAKSYENKSKSFSISLNRQQLADYLGVDRAAMTVVLTELMNDGYITFNKNDFTLTDKALEEI